VNNNLFRYIALFCILACPNLIGLSLLTLVINSSHPDKVFWMQFIAASELVYYGVILPMLYLTLKVRNVRTK
jgi:hypothetical protein